MSPSLRLFLALSLAGCGSASIPVNAKLTANVAASSAFNPTRVYQPLAVGDWWKYVCNHTFTIEDRVIGAYHLKGKVVYGLSLQIPSSPTKSTYEVQLLANDLKGNTWIHGYLVHGKIQVVRPAEIVAAKPILNQHYYYSGPVHGKISRISVGFEYTNRTPLGIFWVAPYFEGGGTHNYGYNLGRGVMEEDHGPHYKYDCLIEKYVLK